jgi:hypothetical protein
MRKLLMAALACALLAPAAATAKEPIRDAKVLFTPAPTGLKAGQVWKARFWFYFSFGRELGGGTRRLTTLRIQ